MNYRIIRANLILFTAALVWGATFVAQRVGMDHMGPLTYTGIRFALGALCLAPAVWLRRPRDTKAAEIRTDTWRPLWGGALAGTAMFFGINLQQIGLVTTTAGNAGFITGLYVVFVPLIGLFRGVRPGWGIWLGVGLGATGLYFLSVTPGFRLSPGDGWILISAMVWAAHFWILGWLSPRLDSFVLAFAQASFCAVLSLLAAWCTEEIRWLGISNALMAIAWGGVMSVAVGFTIQVIGQKDSPPVHAAIILQLEAVVAAVTGWLLLDESLGFRGVFGAGLMLAGMLLAQIWSLVKENAGARG